MSRLLEIFGSAVKYDTADLIWNWLEIVLSRQKDQTHQEQNHCSELKQIIETVFQKKIDSAKKKLLSYMAGNPASLPGRLALAAVCIWEGQIERAIEELNEVYHRQPNNTMALYALGHCSELKGCEEDAIAFYQDCIKFKSYLRLPRQRLAAIYFKNGQIEDAIQQYEMLKHDNPEDIPVLITLGCLYIEASKFSDAVDTFNTAILIHPDNFDDSENETEQLISEGRLEEAAQRLENLISEIPERADLLVRYGDVLTMMGAGSEAIDQYQQAVESRPNFLEATIKLGTVLLQMGSTQAAAIQFNKALEINEEIVDAYIGLASAQYKADSISEAAETLALACAIVPNSTLLFTHAAVLQLQWQMEGKHLSYPETEVNFLKDIIKAHQEQATQQSDNPELFYRLGILMCSTNNFEQAINYFKNAVDLNPYYSRARNKLILCLFESGKKEDALENLDYEDCYDKQSLDLHYKIALLYCDKIKFASSIINFENNLQGSITGCSNTSFNISIVLQNLGLLDRTVLMWENLTDTARQALKSKDAF
jgi:tetratricopeptide (TPR) repeat protein